MVLFYKIEDKSFINNGVDVDIRTTGCYYLGKKIQTYEGKRTLYESYKGS